METGTGPQTKVDMVSDLLEAHHQQLVAHARRELRMAELGDQLPRGMLEARDVVDEVARVCLAEPGNKPEMLTYEQWFYQLTRQELDQQCRCMPRIGTTASARHLKNRRVRTERRTAMPTEPQLGLIPPRDRMRRRPIGALYPGSSSNDRQGVTKSKFFKNPMHRSGLALAGAQTTIEAWKRDEVPAVENDGILTAEDVSTLDLQGTWLVILSVCDTGLGRKTLQYSCPTQKSRGFPLLAMLLTLPTIPLNQTNQTLNC